MSGNNESAIDVLAEQIKSRNNPTDLKAAIIGVVVNLEPLTVGIDNELIYLVAHIFIIAYFKGT